MVKIKGTVTEEPKEVRTTIILEKGTRIIIRNVYNRTENAAILDSGLEVETIEDIDATFLVPGDSL